MYIEKVELYYNEKIITFLELVRKVKVLKGGRGCGKTRSIPEDILDRAAELPRARIFLASMSYIAIMRNIIPDVREVFRLHGLVEGTDYVINKRPPAHFIKPYKEIEDPDNSISLYNGFAIQFVSMGRISKKDRGQSYDGGIIDEALNLKGFDVENVLMPTIRGLDRWDGNPYWKMISIYSSHPRDAEGSWFMKFKKLAEAQPAVYGWVEATAMDNLAVLGEDYIDEQRDKLSFVDFQIEIMNEGKTKDLPLLFYYQYNESHHNYYADLLQDVDPELELEVSFDFGGNFSCMTVSQEQGQTENYVYEFDTNNLTRKQQEAGIVKKVPNLIDDFCDTFLAHKKKHVNIYGERQGLNANEMDEQNNFDKIIDRFQSQGWECELKVTYADSALHKSRYNFMNSCLEEKTPGYPILRVNGKTCPNFVTALNRTRVKDDFKKDKKDERNPHYNQSHAPHFTDTFDYKIFNKYFYLLDDDYSGSDFTGIDGGIESF